MATPREKVDSWANLDVISTHRRGGNISYIGDNCQLSLFLSFALGPGFLSCRR
jgi:hypothetical protein